MPRTAIILPFIVAGGVLRVPLPCGRVALADTEDAELLAPWRWRSHDDGHGNFYVRATGPGKPYMHRLVTDAAAGELVDHRDFDTLNNRKGNLRRSTSSQNTIHARREAPALSQYRGVYRAPHGKPYYVEIAAECGRVSVGKFYDPIEAAHAYDEAAIRYHGEFAILNFPDLHDPEASPRLSPSSPGHDPREDP